MPHYGTETCCWDSLYGDEIHPIQAWLIPRASTGTDRVNITGYSPGLWNRVASDLASYPQIVGAAIFADAAGPGSEPLKAATVPQIHHLAGKSDALLARSKNLTAYEYPTVGSFLFSTPFQPEFAYNSESISHTRNLTFFKNLMGGPYFDLEAIWEEHTYYEFDKRSVECTMATMVQEPYVNHIPTVSLHVFTANCPANVRIILRRLIVPSSPAVLAANNLRRSIETISSFGIRRIPRPRS